MTGESYSTLPSSHTSEGAFTTGLMARNCSKVLNTEIAAELRGARQQAEPKPVRAVAT